MIWPVIAPELIHLAFAGAGALLTHLWWKSSPSSSTGKLPAFLHDAVVALLGQQQQQQAHTLLGDLVDMLRGAVMQPAPAPVPSPLPGGLTAVLQHLLTAKSIEEAQATLRDLLTKQPVVPPVVPPVSVPQK